MVPVDVRRSADRFVTRRPGSTTRHSFSFGHHYDPGNVSFGPVVAVNDELLEPGAGFDDHPHSGLVIVTYVVQGSLAHQGISAREVHAGELAVLRSGAGVVHAERNAGPGELRFVQTWITTADPTTSYDVVDGPVVLEQATVEAGEVPAQSFTGHLLVATGSALVDGIVLTQGDAARTDVVVEVVPGEGAALVLVSC